MGIRENNLDVDLKCEELTAKGRAILQKWRKVGFLPYKRRVAERDLKWAENLSEKQEKQARVCS